MKKDKSDKPRTGKRRATVGGTSQSAFAGGMSAMLKKQPSTAVPAAKDDDRAGLETDEKSEPKD